MSIDKCLKPEGYDKKATTGEEVWRTRWMCVIRFSSSHCYLRGISDGLIAGSEWTNGTRNEAERKGNEAWSVREKKRNEWDIAKGWTEGRVKKKGRRWWKKWVGPWSLEWMVDATKEKRNGKEEWMCRMWVTGWMGSSISSSSLGILNHSWDIHRIGRGGNLIHRSNWKKNDERDGGK